MRPQQMHKYVRLWMYAGCNMELCYDPKVMGLSLSIELGILIPSAQAGFRSSELNSKINILKWLVIECFKCNIKSIIAYHIIAFIV